MGPQAEIVALGTGVGAGAVDDQSGRISRLLYGEARIYLAASVQR